MKTNMNNWTADEIINHLELYGDEHGGNLLRIIKGTSQELDDANEIIIELESDDSEQLEINRLKGEVEGLEEENAELQEKLDKILEIQ